MEPMAATVARQEARPAPAGRLEAALRSRIQALSNLPTSAAVAVKFIELGRDPDTGPQDYAKVVASDASLSGKLLALANSSWFGVRQPVTKVSMAVSLLGLCNVRALALSHCMTVLHRELGLSRADESSYWEAGLCKAVTAKRYVEAFDASLADVAFAAGMFEDFALPIMHAIDKGQTAQVLSDPGLSPAQKMESERSRFGMEHSEAGRLLAQKLALPAPYVDTTAFHHDAARLHQGLESQPLADGVYLAGLMPHIRGAWHAEDIQRAKDLVSQRLEAIVGGWAAFLDGVQKELDELVAYFQQGKAPELKLREMAASSPVV